MSCVNILAWSVCETSTEGTYHSFEDNIRFAVLWRVDDTWTVDEEDAPHQRDVLPHLKTVHENG